MGLISRVSSRTYRFIKVSFQNMAAPREKVVDKYKSILTRPAEEYINDASVEERWAEKAFKEAEVHFKLITSLKPSMLKLCQQDDEIYSVFREQFPKFNVEMVDEDSMKTKEGKEKWRPFCNHFEDKVEDFNRGSLLRTDASKEFGQDNCTLTTRIQFLAIEIARNREGANDKIYNEHNKK